MSQPFVILLVALTFNLAGMLVIYSFMAFFLTRLQWRGRGVPAVFITILIAGVFWILPAIISLDYAYSFFFGNWLVSTFSIVLFSQTVKRIPRQLEDSMRLDGCGWFGTYWHVVLPLVRRDLGFITFLIVMATTLPFFTELIRQGGIDCYPSLRLSTYDFPSMLAMSAITSLPVIAIFFVAKRLLLHAPRAVGTRTGFVATR
jgi:multiple sugar transport system permease protein